MADKPKKVYPPIVRIDREGVPIGPITFKEGHRRMGGEYEQELFHSTTNLLIYDTPLMERVLLQLRQGVVGSGKWDASAGGHLDWLVEENRPMTPEECAQRELNEELFSEKGIPDELRLQACGSMWKRHDPNNQELTYLFRGIYPGPFNPNDEVADVQFVPFPGVLKDIYANPQNYTNNIRLCLERDWARVRK